MIRVQKQERASQTNAHLVSMAVPDWMPMPQWTEFLKHRRQARKPLSQLAIELLVKEFFQLRLAGNDPEAVLEQSIRSGWCDVFPLRNGKTNQSEDERLGLSRFGHTAANDNARMIRNAEQSRFFPEGTLKICGGNSSGATAPSPTIPKSSPCAKPMSNSCLAKTHFSHE